MCLINHYTVAFIGDTMSVLIMCVVPMTCKVSIFMPTYNHEQFIAEALESVLSQDYDNIEIVCGDDYSTDKTAEIIRSYADKYPNKMRPIYNSENLGVTKNCNKVLSQCDGEYVVMFSGDDIMMPNKVSRLMQYMNENPDCAVCYHDLEVFDSATNATICLYSDVQRSPGPDVRSLLKVGTAVAGPCLMVRRSAMPEKGYNEAVSTISDWLLAIEIATQGSVGYVNEVLTRYRRHVGNMSNSLNYYHEYFIAIGILRSKYPKISDALTKYEGYLYACFMARYLRERNFDLAFSYAKQSFIRGYKFYLTLPLYLVSLFRVGPLTVVIDYVVSRFFNFLDSWRKRKLIDYKLYQEKR